jgi:hypothetical protein
MTQSGDEWLRSSNPRGTSNEDSHLSEESTLKVANMHQISQYSVVERTGFRNRDALYCSEVSQTRSLIVHGGSIAGRGRLGGTLAFTLQQRWHPTSPISIRFCC